MSRTEQQIPVGSIHLPKVLTRPIDRDFVENDLAPNIKKHGLKQPILVRPDGQFLYEVVFGAQRFQAVKFLGWPKIRAYVEKLDDDKADILKIAENTRNPYIDPVVEGEIFARLLKKYGTINDLAEETGKRIPYIKDRLLVYHQLEISLRKLVGKGLTVSNAISLAKIPDHLRQKELAEKIVESRTTVSGGWAGSGYGTRSVNVSLACSTTCPKCGKVLEHTKRRGTVTIASSPEE